MTPAHPEAFGTGRLLSQSLESPHQPGLLSHTEKGKGERERVGDGHDSEGENEKASSPSL